METKRKKGMTGQVLIRIGICSLVLLVGITGMLALAKMKKPPAETLVEERPLKVEALRVVPETVDVRIIGYGEAKTLNEVEIAPEVAGKITDIHPRLEVGEIISEGERLFEVDSRDYDAALGEAQAMVQLWQNSISRLEKEYRLDKDRLKTLTRNRELAKTEFERLRSLFEKDKVGTQSNVENAEQAYNATVDQVDIMVQSLEVYPIRIKESKNNLSAAKAKLSQTETNVKRCRVAAPFTGRVKAVNLERGQYVNPGLAVLTLADDSMIEIQIPIDSRDARNWLRFDNAKRTANAAWFSGLESVACEIRWTEDRSHHAWEGRLHRIVKFSPQTRTLVVAVRVDAEKILSLDNGALPLVDGMFCSVAIPGRQIENAVLLPQWAVSFENTVYVSQENRLQTRAVQVARTQKNNSIITGGLKPGELVVITRLVDPLENSLLEVSERRL
jgi:RND family efflux transporter MFP subunit